MTHEITLPYKKGAFSEDVLRLFAPTLCTCSSTTLKKIECFFKVGISSSYTLDLVNMKLEQTASFPLQKIKRIKQLEEGFSFEATEEVKVSCKEAGSAVKGLSELIFKICK